MTPEQMKQLPVGAEVIVDALAKRVYTEREAFYATCPAKKGNRTAIYIGYRTVNNGVFTLEDTPQGYSQGYEPENYFTLGLVVLSPRHNPVFVFPCNILFVVPPEVRSYDR